MRTHPAKEEFAKARLGNHHIYILTNEGIDGFFEEATPIGKLNLSTVREVQRNRLWTREAVCGGVELIGWILAHQKNGVCRFQICLNRIYCIFEILNPPDPPRQIAIEQDWFQEPNQETQRCLSISGILRHSSFDEFQRHWGWMHQMGGTWTVL